MVGTVVFSGITLDAKLDLGLQITKLSNSLRFAVYALKKVRQHFDVETSRLVYFDNSILHFTLGICR